MAKVRKGKSGGGKGKDSSDLHAKLEGLGIDLIDEVARLLSAPTTSDRIKADLLKDLLNYRYSKQKSVQMDVDTGSGIVFNLDLAGKE